jgi:hypothetical protein
MRLRTSTDIRPEVGERVGLRIGDVVFGCEVIGVDGERVEVELVDAELMRNTGVHLDHPPRYSQDADANPLPPGPEAVTWVASRDTSTPSTVA